MEKSAAKVHGVLSKAFSGENKIAADQGATMQSLGRSFWAGFEKSASAFAHAAELGGLGLLAHGSVKHLSGKPLTEDRTHKEEIAGLGILAAPSAHAAAVGTRDAFRAARKGAKGAVGAGAIAQGAWKGLKKWHQATGH